MATLSDSTTSSNGQKRKKPITYGKAARGSPFTAQSVGSFFDESQDAHRHALRRAKPTTKAHTPIKRALPPQTPLRDEFDVPVSDEESAPEHVKSPSAVTPALSSRRDKRGGAPRFASKTPKEHKRKSLEHHAPAAHKRTRTLSPVSPDTSDNRTFVGAGDVRRSPSPFHGTSAVKPENTRNSRSSKRTPVPSTLARSTPVKGFSAPAYLDQMLSEHLERDDSGAITTGSTAQHQHLHGPSIARGTPTRESPKHPAALRRTASTTPKQSHLWSQLLSSDPVEPDHEELDDHAMDTPKAQSTQSRRPGLTSSHRLTSKSQQHSVPRQARLVDRLKQMAQSSDASGPEDDEAASVESFVHSDAAIGTGNPSPDTRVTSPNESQMPTLPESQLQQSESQTALSQTALGTKMTYARTRSYLQEDTLEDTLMLSVPVPVPNPVRTPATSRRIGTHPQGNKSAPRFDIDDDSDTDTNGIRSIHELRAAGNKKRFLDDNAALLDDIKDHNIASRSKRRSALMELAIKLFEKSFLTRFTEHGFDRSISAELSAPYPDLISDATLCVVLSQLLDHGIADTSLPALHKAGALEVAARCLNERRLLNKVLRDRNTNMSKVAQSAYLDFAESVRLASIWGEAKPEALSIQLLGLKCVELMVLRLRRQGNKGSVLSPELVSKLVDLAVDTDTAATATAPDDNPESPTAMARRLALSILEFASTSDALSTTWSTELWERVVTVLPQMLRLQDESRALVLKLCINLTNNNMVNCNACSRSEVIEAIVHQIVDGFRYLHDHIDEQEHKSRLDVLILSLGLMINLVEFSDAACEETAALKGDASLASMVATFLRGQERVEEAQSEEETHSNVAYGFLAVLLGNICQNGRARADVRALLPGKTLQKLAATIDEFAQYNIKVDSQTFEGDEGREVWEHFTGRLMAVVARLQEFEA